VPIDRNTYESLEHLKDTVDRWNAWRATDQLRACVFGAETPVELKLYAIDVSFDAIGDSAERDYFMGLPTTFTLPADAIDRLRAVGAKLLRESPAFRDLMRDLGGAPAS
jgi:NTE family protein